MTVVTIHQAKTNLSKLIKAALAGEDIVIARGKEPMVRLTPTGTIAPPKRQYGRWKGQIKFDDRFSDPMTDEELRDWGMV